MFTRDNGTCPYVINRLDGNDCFDTVLFTPNIVKDVLRKLKPSTSAGSDSIPNIFLKKMRKLSRLAIVSYFSYFLL